MFSRTCHLFPVYKRFGDVAASYNVQSLVRRAFGQVPGGMFGADENARIGFFDPRQGTETCGFVEQMASDEIMLLISGDPYWADHLEDVAFNSYPASLMPDYRASSLSDLSESWRSVILAIIIRDWIIPVRFWP